MASTGDIGQVEAEQELAGYMRTLGELNSNVAHDFSNLLAVIVGYAEMAEDEEDDPNVRRILREIRSAAARAADLCGDLLSFSRAVTNAEVIDLDALIAGLAELLRVSMGGQAEVTFEPSPQALPGVLAERHPLEQVLLNLAVNARDAMPRGGTLAFRTSTIHLDEGSSGSHPGISSGWYVVLAVQDTGVGMSPGIQARIFDRYFSTKPAGTGTGLGLATVRDIISDFGGTIEVDSQEGLGTTFRIYLPARARRDVDCAAR